MRGGSIRSVDRRRCVLAAGGDARTGRFWTAWSEVRSGVPSRVPIVRVQEPRIKLLPAVEWTEEQRALLERYAPPGDVARPRVG